MAIGKITKGNGFYGVMSYLLDKEKNPEIIGGCIVGEKADDIAREFRQVANLRPGIEKPVRHFSISFAPEDGHVDRLIKEAIAYRILDGLGYENCQFMAIGHDRAQKNHDKVHNHDHMHIVANAVTLEGKHVRDSFDAYKTQEVLRKVEKEFGLHQIKSSWEVKNEKGMGVNRESEIAKLVATSLEDKPSLKEWLGRLAVNEIDVRFNLTNKDVVQGVSFVKDGEAYKGSNIGAKWSSQKKDKYPNSFNDGSSIVSEIIQISPQDIPLMKAANLKSQEHSVRLNEVDRAMFDRSAEMAEMAVLRDGRNGKFRNGRVEIALDSDRLKVRRVRPEKVMLEAKRVDGKWAPLGFPNIGKVDVQLLERINKAEEMSFKEIERKASSKPNPDRVKVEQLKDLPEAELRDFPEVELKYSPKANLENNQTEAEIKERIQEAIDWAGEQSNTSGEEYIEYLKQQGVKTNLELNANGDIMDIIYNMDGVRFESKELIDASPQQLSSARDLTFNLRKKIEESTPLKKLPQIDIKNGDPFLHLQKLMSNPQNSSMEEPPLRTTIDREDATLHLENLLKLFNLPPTLPIGEPKVTEKKTSTPDPETVISMVEIVADPTPIIATVKIVADPTPPPPSKISLPEIADLPLTLKVRKIKTRSRDGR
jgi:Relaxase/Mobilisation nuclease domain